MGMIIINGEEYASSPKDGFPPIIYSDEEREIGVWRDGKPLYQKSFYISSLTSGYGSLDLTSLNIDTIGYMDGRLTNRDGEQVPVPNAHTNGFSDQSFVRYNSDKSLGVYLGSGIYPATNIVITIKYTKTTDTPGSGKYTTYGGLTHHYSTSEQVVGTWIDGKPIYEKVIETDQVINNSSQRLISKSDISSNLDQMIEFHGYYYDSNHSYMINDNYYDNSDYHSMLIWEGNNFLSFIKMSSSSFPYLRIICRYTKTTD